MKEEKLEEARVIFALTKINITTEGGFIDKKNSRDKYGNELVKWINKIEKLSLIHGLFQLWSTWSHMFS